MAPILESFFAKTMVNTYLRKKPLMCNSIYPTGEKLGIMIMEKLSNKYSFKDAVESSLGKKIINTCINTYIGRDVVNDVKRLLDEEKSDSKFKLKVALDVHPIASLNSSSMHQFKFKLGGKFKLKPFDNPFEAHITNDNVSFGMECLWTKLDYPVNIPWADYQLTQIPVKMTIKPVFDFAKKNLSISATANGGKFFTCCATFGLTFPYTPTFGSSIVFNLGWIDATLTVKPQSMRFNGNFNVKPEIGFHVTMTHNNKHGESKTRGTINLSQSDGARRFAVNTGGIILGGKVQKPLNFTWEVGCDLKDQKIGLKFLVIN